MELVFHGIGSAFNVKKGNNSASFHFGKKLFLLDSGGTVFQELLRTRRLDGWDEIHIFITHLHPDHVGSLGDLIFFVKHMRKSSIHLYYPEIEKLVGLLGLSGVKPENFYAHGENTIHFIEKDPFGIQFLPQKHSENIPAYGLLLLYLNTSDATGGEHKGFFYSGDSAELNKIAFQMLEQGEIDLFYQDVCSYEAPASGHLFYGDLLDAVPASLRGRVVLMHRDENFDEEWALKDGFLLANVT